MYTPSPSCSYETIEQVRGAAVLLGMWYDPQDHTFNGHDKMVCADTLEVLGGDDEYLRPGEQARLSVKREREVAAGTLGFIYDELAGG